MAKGKKKREDENVSPMSLAAHDKMELQLYPRFATVGDFKSEPRCVHPRQWVKDADIDMCKRCKEEFTFVVRKHHCRICGQIYCQTCSCKSLPLTKEDDTVYDIRVCLGCYADYQQPVVKNYKERSLGSNVSVKGSSMQQFTEQHLYHVLGFLTVHQMLSTLGSVCRDLYFICREDPLWTSLGLGLPLEMSTGSIPRFPSLSSSPTPCSPTSDGANAEERPSPASGERTPVNLGGGLLVHPMSLYQRYCSILVADRKKRYKLLHKRLHEIISNPVKVGVVGPSGVGKSHLVNSFVYGRWDTPGNMGETSGGRVRCKGYIACPIVKITRYPGLEQTSGVLDIVDCSGNGRYSSLMPTYLSGVQVLLVCINSQGKSNDVLLNMISEVINDHTPHCLTDTVIVVCFLSPPPPDLPIHKAHPRITAVTTADPFTGIGVKDVFRMCIQLLIDRDVVHLDPQCKPPEKRPQATPMDILLGGGR